MRVKLRTQCSLLLGRFSIQVPSRTLTPSVVAGLVYEVRLPGVHAPNFSVTDCDLFIEGEEWDVFFFFKKKSKYHFARTFLCDRGVQKEYAKRIPTALTHRYIRGVNPD